MTHTLPFAMTHELIQPPIPRMSQMSRSPDTHIISPYLKIAGHPYPHTPDPIPPDRQTPKPSLTSKYRSHAHTTTGMMAIEMKRMKGCITRSLALPTPSACSKLYILRALW